MKRVTPGQSAMIRRLVAAGCPIANRQLLSQEYPLRVFEGMPGMGTNILPLSSGGTGIALRLRIVAVSATTITGFSLRKTNWANFPITWADFCEEHAGYCLHNGVDEWAQIEAGNTLNFRIFHLGCVLKPGGCVDGYLLGTTPEHLMPIASEKLDAILIVTNGLADEFPFPISISTSPVMASAIQAVPVKPRK